MVVPDRAAANRRPRPLLSQRAEERLGPRHREVLGQLEGLFLQEGFAGLSVRELAGSVGCSRRTLYELAPSKDELVLLVLDRFLHRVGRDAIEAIDAECSYADQITAYFLGGIELQRLSHVFGEDLADDASARRLFDRHYSFVMALTEQLVRDGVEAGEFRPVEPAIVAGVLAGTGMFFNQPDVRADSGLELERAIEGALDLIVRSILV